MVHMEVKSLKSENHLFLFLPILGNGGDMLTDGDELHKNGLISRVELRTGREVDAIRTQYGETWSDVHGSGGGSSHMMEMAKGAKIIIVQGRSGSK